MARDSFEYQENKGLIVEGVTKVVYDPDQES